MCQTLWKVGTKLLIHDFIAAPELFGVQDVFSVQELRAQSSGLLASANKATTIVDAIVTNDVIETELCIFCVVPIHAKD